MRKQKVKEFWNRMANEYDKYASTHAGYAEQIKELINIASPAEKDIAMDVGCGTGTLSILLAQMVKRLYAIDISMKMIKILLTKAGAKNINIEVITADARSIPLLSSSVDLVISNYSLHHLRNEGKISAVREFYRVLKPHGRVVIGDVMFSPNDRERVMKERLEATKKMLGRKGYFQMRIGELLCPSRYYEEYNISIEEWHKILSYTGFRNINCKMLAYGNGIIYGQK